MKKLSTFIISASLVVASLGCSVVNPTTANAATTIPADAFTYGGHSYYIYSDATSWDEAELFCEIRGGHLATITSEEENTAVYGYLKSKDIKNAYIGLTDKEVEGQFKWVTGEEVTYTNWHQYEPNHENENEDYAMFYYKYSDGTWNDGDFGGSTVNGGVNYICEWGDAIIPVTLTIPEDTVTYGGHRYYIFTDAASWNSVMLKCQARGCYPASITSQEENDFLFKYMKQKGYDSAYFGYSDSTVEGQYEWLSGEAKGYENWHEYEPNHENEREDYAMFYYKYPDGTWNDGDFGGTTVNGGIAYIVEWGSARSPQKITVSKKCNKTVKYKAKNLKKKKAVLKINAKADNGVTYKLVKGNKKYISVNKKGVVTLKKNCKKGTYKILIKAPASDTLDMASKTITIKVQ